MTPSITPTREAVADALREAGTISGAARALGLDRRRLSERVNADEELRALVAPRPSRAEPRERPGLTVDGDEATATSDAVEGGLADVRDAESYLRERWGLSEEEWVAGPLTVNEWQGPVAGGGARTFAQVKGTFRKRLALAFATPATHVPRIPRRRTRARAHARPRLAVVMGDHQAPYHDRALHGASLAFLAEMRPDVGVHLGDLLDFPSISRHRDNPAFNAAAQECVQAGYDVLRDLREASPATEWTLIEGNHDERLRTELLTRAERMYGIRPADTGAGREEDALSLKRLLHLDALGVDLVPNVGGYAHGEVKLAPKLAVRHGWLTGEGTARKTLSRLGVSVIVGHTHSKDSSWTTRYGDGDPTLLVAHVAGTMSQFRNGLGYAVNPDWQQGFVTASIWPDGRFTVDHATFVDGALYWRDRRWEGDANPTRSDAP